MLPTLFMMLQLALETFRPFDLFHYTDEEGMKAILESGIIRASQLTGQDAAFGKGVYLTRLNPSHGKEKILTNNYGDHRKYPTRADCYIKFVVTRSFFFEEFKEATSFFESRSVWLVCSDIDLKSRRYRYVPGKTDDWKEDCCVS